MNDSKPRSTEASAAIGPLFFTIVVATLLCTVGLQHLADTRHLSERAGTANGAARVTATR